MLGCLPKPNQVYQSVTNLFMLDILVFHNMDKNTKPSMTNDHQRNCPLNLLTPFNLEELSKVKSDNLKGCTASCTGDN